jgi:glutamate 5-kinase
VPVPPDSRKWWILHGLHSAGAITIDQGAFRALTRRESGGRLLPAGILKVEGSFASLQAVRVIVRLRKDRSREVRSGPSDERRRSSAFDAAVSAVPEGGTKSGETTIATTPSIQTQPTSPRLLTAPGTPKLNAAASLSSSIVSLDPPLSQPTSAASGSTSSASLASSAAHSLSAALSAGVEALHVATSSQGEAERPPLESSGSRETIKPVPSSADSASISADAGDEWEYIEVGKGQVHYNSSEIDRVKGLKTCVPSTSRVPLQPDC